MYIYESLLHVTKYNMKLHVSGIHLQHGLLLIGNQLAVIAVARTQLVPYTSR